ncbi:hypothetical protein WJX72_009406 [[Myrmecia] bisecta]|uniref:Transmembrane protein 230 n=1 Tax=[Myrmecia] bisecta TaxID=41462 RepID=A0AAW1PND6_9CHLO
MSTLMRSGILESHSSTARSKSRNSPRAVAAVVLILGIFATLWTTLAYLQSHTEAKPMLVVLFPIAAITGILAIIPLFIYLSYQARLGTKGDFEKLNPLRPTHYWFLVKKTYTALQNNNLKVSAKDI